MLPAPLGRNGSHRSLQYLQECLLDSLAGYVPGDGWVFRLAGDLVQLIHVDDAPLRLGDVEVRCLQEANQDVLHVLTHISGFGEGGGVGNGEGNLEHPGEGLCQQGLPDAGGSHEEDVGLFDLHLVQHALMVHPLVMVVHGHRQRPLGVVLADHILVQDLLDLHGCGAGDLGFDGFPLLFLRQDLVAEGHTLVADVDGRPRDELLDAVFGFSTEAAPEMLVAGHAHGSPPCGHSRPALVSVTPQSF